MPKQSQLPVDTSPVRTDRATNLKSPSASPQAVSTAWSHVLGLAQDIDVNFTDVTTGNASASKHGFLPKLSGAATDFLNGVGAFAVPAGGGSVTALGANVNTQESTNSGSYTDLATAGPSVTLTTGTAVIVWLSCYQFRSGTGGSGRMGVAVSGATTLAASDANAALQTSAVSNSVNQNSRVLYLSGLTAGSNTFTAKYMTEGGVTWNFVNRSIAVLAL